MPSTKDCSDLISKFEAVDRIDTYFCVTCYVKKEGGACGGCMIKDVKEIIDDTNAVDAEPVRHGRWEPNQIQEGWFRELVFCSECGAENSSRKTNYCPNCGAKMIDGDTHEKEKAD